MSHYQSWRRSSIAIGTSLAMLATSLAGITPAGAVTAAAPSPRGDSALTGQQPPRADDPGAVRTTPGIGGDPSSRPWAPAVTAVGPATGVTARSGVRPAAGVGKPGIGLQEWYPVELRQLADRLQLLVNTANGNLMVRYFDVKIGGSSLWPAFVGAPDGTPAAGVRIGLLTLLGLLVAAGRLPPWSPVLFLAGYVSISVRLDLLPFWRRRSWWLACRWFCQRESRPQSEAARSARPSAMLNCQLESPNQSVLI